MKRIAVYGFISCLFFAGCGGAPRTEVEYRYAEGYYVRNDVADETLIEKITTPGQFDKYFGAAATMSRLPTPVDFSGEYVVAVIMPRTDHSTDIRADSLVWHGAQADLYYSVATGARLGFTIRPAMLLVVDRKYDGKLAVTVNDAGQRAADGIRLLFKDGKASAGVYKKEGESITFVFELAVPARIRGVLTSPDPAANVRFTQIVMPDGTADGPFGRELDYAPGQKGVYRLSAGENMMAGDRWGGVFKIELSLTE